MKAAASAQGVIRRRAWITRQSSRCFSCTLPVGSMGISASFTCDQLLQASQTQYASLLKFSDTFSHVNQFLLGRCAHVWQL